MRIDLRALRYFLGVAEQGSFCRASEVLHVAQSALSRQVKRLEDEVGVPLLVRHARGVGLTATGAELRDRAERLLDAAERLTDGLTQPEPDIDSVIRIGLPPVLGQRLGARIIADFRRLWPRTGVQIRLAGSVALTDWLVSGQVELALIHNATPLDGITLEPVLQETLHVVLPSGAEAPDTYPISALARLPLILPSWPDNERRLLEALAERHAFRLQPALEIDSVALIRASVEQGLGVAVLPRSVVQDEVTQNRLRCVPLAGAPQSTLTLATARDKSQTLALAGLRRCVSQVLASAVDSGDWQGADLSGALRQVEKTG